MIKLTFAILVAVTITATACGTDGYCEAISAANVEVERSFALYKACKTYKGEHEKCVPEYNIYRKAIADRQMMAQRILKKYNYKLPH